MKTTKMILYFHLLLVLVSLTSCRRSGSEVWEDTKTSGRYMGTGLKKLGGKHGDSRQICDRGEFYAVDGEDCDPANSDFIPLDGADMGNYEMSDFRQARETPGEAGSSIPGIDSFRDPSTDPALAAVFQNIYFELNSSLIKGQENLDSIHKIANYLKRNPDTYIFVEGHTDERGAEAYNLALGSHRANGVRNMLISEGVNPDNIFTISYGRERPIVIESHEEAWSQNRRAEFKVYQR